MALEAVADQDRTDLVLEELDPLRVQFSGRGPAAECDQQGDAQKKGEDLAISSPPSFVSQTKRFPHDVAVPRR